METTVESRLMDFITTNAGILEEEIDKDANVFEEGLLNSLFLIQLMAYMEKEFSIKILPDDLSLTNFASLNEMVRFVDKKKVEKGN